MRHIALLLLAIACSGGMSLDRRANAPGFPKARCELTDRSATGLPVESGEKARELVCSREGGRMRNGILIVDHLDRGATIGDRLVDAYRHDGEWGATAPATTAPTILSGVAAIEHRQAFELLGRDQLVLRYVQEGDSLFAAWASGSATLMEAREAENAAWLDAVRFDDLTSPK